MEIRITTDEYEYQGLYKDSVHEADISQLQMNLNGKVWYITPDLFEIVSDSTALNEKDQMTACDFLSKALSLLEERGKDYDQPQGERSMGRTVSAFNSITNKDLTEAEGWLLLQLLKDVRQWQNPDKYHADSAEDCVSYAALKAEALFSAD